MSPEGDRREPKPEDRPWQRLAEWTDLYGGARESLRVARASGREREAESDLWEVVRSERPAEDRERAAFMLWAMLVRQGRNPDAEPELHEAILDKDGNSLPEIWGGAWYSLGYFLILLGDKEAAELPIRRAIESGHVDVVDQAQCNLGIALSSVEGRERDAEELLRQAAEHGGPFGENAECALCLALTSQAGREREAEAALRRAIDRRHPNFLTQALCNLGILLASQEGREPEAEAILRRATESYEYEGDTYFAARAAAHLERLMAGEPPKRVVVLHSGEHPV